MQVQIENVDEASYRKAMRQWVSGVTVVASAYQGSREGMTVSSFISVSLDPPTLLVSLKNDAQTLKIIKQAKVFSVNVLQLGQATLSNRFAVRAENAEDRFADLETFVLTTQSPLLQGCLAGFDCQLLSLEVVGDHTLVIGKVVAMVENESQEPLVYYQQNYQMLAPADENQEA